jgi:hypothetical protein
MWIKAPDLPYPVLQIYPIGFPNNTIRACTCVWYNRALVSLREALREALKKKTP